MVEIAAAVKHDTAEDVGDTATALPKSLHLLGSIAHSLRHD
jgi:hypothetical protein